MASVITDYGSPYVRGVSGIDGTVVGNTALLIAEPAEVRHYVMLVNFALGTTSGLVSGPSISVGTNSPNFNDIVAVTAVPIGFAGTFFLSPLSTTPVVTGGLTVNVRVSIAAVATTYTFRVHLFILSVQNTVP